MNKEFQELFDRAGISHGHLCPSLCLGVRSALFLRKTIGEQKIATGSLRLEATTKCFKDGAMTVLGEDRLLFAATPGVCRLTWNDGGKKVCVTVGKDIRGKMGALKKDLEPDTGKFQREGLAILSQIKDEDIFQVE